MAFLEEYRGIGAAEVAQQQAGLVSQWLVARPRELFAELRRYNPIFRTPSFVIATRFKDVQEVLGHESVFSVRLYQSRMDPIAGPFMLSRDNTVLNQRDKGIMLSMLRREDMPAIRAMVASIAERNLSELKQRDGIELISGLSRRVPIQLVGEYFGFPGPDIESMFRWSRATQMEMFRNPTRDPAISEAAVQAGAEMRAYLHGYLPQRREAIAQNPDLDDVLSRILKSRFPEVIGFDEERIIANTMGLLIGAGETTSQAIAQVLDQFFQRPHWLGAAKAAARAGDDNLLGQYVWEALRFNPISSGILRYCEEDYTIARGTDRETLIQKGTLVFAATLSAMFDEHEIPEPETFRPDRPDYHYFHFGYGHHLCLGHDAGYVMIPEVIKQLLLRKNLRRSTHGDGKIDYKGGPFPEAFWVDYDD